MSKYTHKVTRNGELYSEHGSQSAAQKRVRRYVAMSNGKLTEADFVVEPMAEPAIKVRQYFLPPVAKRWTRPTKQRYARFIGWRRDLNTNYLEGL